MEFEKGEEISVLPCNHFYHPDCITQWMKINKVPLPPRSLLRASFVCLLMEAPRTLPSSILHHQSRIC